MNHLNLARVRRINLRRVAIAAALAASLLPTGLVQSASPGAAPRPDDVAPLLQPVTVLQTGDTVSFAWRGQEARTPDGKSTVRDITDWALGTLGGAELPVKFTALEATGAVAPAVHLSVVEDAPFTGELSPVRTEVPSEPLTGETYPNLAETREINLPDLPLLISHSAIQRGQTIVVVAMSPIYRNEKGETRIATRVEGYVSGVKPLDTSRSPFDAESRVKTAVATEGLAAPFVAEAYAINPLANTTALKITVVQAGMQRISGSALSPLGNSLATINPNRVRLFLLGIEVPLFFRDGGTSPGILDAGDDFLWYAPTVGDRYNQSTVYWMSVDPAIDGARMATVNLQPPASPAAGAGYGLERGSWYVPLDYRSIQAGTDGDHWFYGQLTAGYVGSVYTVSVSTPTRMPAMAGSSLLTVTVQGTFGYQHYLNAQTNGASQTTGWTSTNPATLAFAMTASGGQALFSLTSTYSKVLIDKVFWERPVDLNVSGGGGDFYTRPDLVRTYPLASYNAAWPIFDVTDPNAPRLAQSSNGVTQAGPDQHHLIVAGPSFVSTPAVASNSAYDLASPRSADVIYISPAGLMAPLGPLTTLRQNQGYVVQVVDLARIYDVFGFGMVGPHAIRNFFRHAVATWTPRAPIAAVLVGDGTMDPFNRLAKSFVSPNFIPPYLMSVDSDGGETACETCYVQLDGDNPLNDALPDMWLGRLSANSTDELTTLVSKITTYETDTSVNAWNKTLGWLADNFQEANGAKDAGGDFATYQEKIANHPWDPVPGITPPGLTKNCSYYNPYLTTLPNSPCFEQYATPAHSRALNVYSQGAAVVTYNGHGNPQQLAGTDPTAAYPNYALINYFDPFGDFYGNPVMSNGNKLPVSMQLTCLTSAFQYPGQFYPQTIDERLVASTTGGSIAVWGSAGKGVSHGHDFLARGFFGVLWSTPSNQTRLGPAIQNGYVNLFTNAYLCCGDSIRTYLLLGDPLTKVRVTYSWAGSGRAYLPQVRR